MSKIPAVVELLNRMKLVTCALYDAKDQNKNYNGWTEEPIKEYSLPLGDTGNCTNFPYLKFLIQT